MTLGAAAGWVNIYKVREARTHAQAEQERAATTGYFVTMVTGSRL